MNKKFYTVYQITNLINDKIYIGVHCTNKLDDKYYGSGKSIKNAIKKYGKENFKKEILFIYDNIEEMISKEEDIVTEQFVNRNDTYNINLGGKTNINAILNYKQTGEHKNKLLGKVRVYDANNNSFKVDVDDERIRNGELIVFSKNTISVKDSDGKCFKVKNDDPRYLAGELVGVNKGMKHKIESINKMKESQYNKTHTQETKDKISIANKGKKRSLEFCEENRNRNLGKTVSETTKMKQSLSRKGKVKSEEHRKKISESHKGKILSEVTKQKIKDSWIQRRLKMKNES